MKHPLLVAAAACAACLCVAVALARPPAPSKPPPPPPAPHHLSLEQAVKQVQHQTHGHILAADSVARGRNQVYRIKVLTNGRVRVMQLHSNQKPKPKPAPSSHGSNQGGH